eukprot:scaffold141569_cov14-Tisochrysis_lutea.AAC.1
MQRWTQISAHAPLLPAADDDCGSCGGGGAAGAANVPSDLGHLDPAVGSCAAAPAALTLLPAAAL